MLFVVPPGALLFIIRLTSGLPWLPAQVRLGAGSPADRMIHRAGDVFGVAVSKTYLIRILGYIRVRFLMFRNKMP